MRLTNGVLAAVAASSVAAAPVLLVKDVSNKNVGGYESMFDTSDKRNSSTELLKRAGEIRLLGQWMAPNKLYKPGEELEELAVQSIEPLRPVKTELKEEPDTLAVDNARPPPNAVHSTWEPDFEPTTSNTGYNHKDLPLSVPHQIKYERLQDEHLQRNYPGPSETFRAMLASPAFKKQVERDLKKRFSDYHGRPWAPGREFQDMKLYNVKPNKHFHAVFSSDSAGPSNRLGTAWDHNNRLKRKFPDHSAGTSRQTRPRSHTSSDTSSESA